MVKAFGGDWTSVKLRCLSEYLKAYTTALSKQDFKTIYIDAFAGTGWLTLKQTEDDEARNKSDGEQGNLFSLLGDVSEFDSSKEPLEGSARIALKVSPSFSKYIFVEQDLQRFSQLINLKSEFPEKDTKFVNSDANDFIRELCESFNWIKEGFRAVLFLDPYGLNVSWETIKIVAKTEAIDLWYLFPFGVGLNRLLTVDGKINSSHRAIIDNVLGTDKWYNDFYKTSTYSDLFESKIIIEKSADFDTISKYLIRRLETIFPGVANNPKMLYNSKKNPLYLLCFASANPRGSKLANKIAQDILRKE